MANGDWDWESFAQQQGWYDSDFGGITTEGLREWDPGKLGDPGFGHGGAGKAVWNIDDYSDLRGLAQDDELLEQYLREEWDFVDPGDYLKYLDTDFGMEELGFAARDRAMGEYKAGKAFDTGLMGIERGVQGQFGTAKQQADTMRGKSGFASSSQLTGLFQDQKEDLIESYAIDKEQQRDAYNMAMADTKAAYDKSVYDITRQQQDEFLESIAQVAPDATAYNEVTKGGVPYYYSDDDKTLKFKEDTIIDGVQYSAGDSKPGSFLGATDKKGPCVVSTALNNTGAWSDAQKLDAVNWCQDTHHDGSERGKTWIKGYHTWGKFLSKWVKKSEIIRYVVDITTDAFVDLTRRNKPNFLGYLIHYGWINPLSYTIGFSKKNKILGKIITPIVISLYTGLFPLFALVSIPSMIKRTLNERRGK